MIKNLNYLKKLIKVLIWPIIFIIGQFFIEYIFVAYYNYNNKGNMTNSEFLKFIKTTTYKESLNKFIDSKLLLISIISFVIFLPIFYLLYKKYKKDRKSNYYIESIGYGITIPVIFNITLYNINSIIRFTNRYDSNTIPIVVSIICTAILGPILEEILFRGIVYNKLKEFNKNMTAIILCSIIFGVFHFDIVNSIYAFGVSFMFIYLYEKYNTLYAPILMHVILNLSTILIVKLNLLNISTVNIILLIVSTLVLILISKRYIGRNKYE